jgi:putative nucleotidyltransferase with HDIG domain
MSSPTTHMDAGTERLIEESLERRHRDLDRRERIGSRLFAAAFFAAAVALAVLGEAARPLDPVLAAVFAAAFAAVARVEFSGGAGYAVPTQIVFVPMLLLLPTTLVPLLVAAALVASSAWQALRGGAALGRSWLAVGDAWFSLGPAVVLVALDAQVPDWPSWPAYVLALGAQLVVDGTISTARVWVCQHIAPAAVVRDLHLVYRVDVLLAPLGLMAAFAAAGEPGAALLVLPLVWLLMIFSREREGRIQQTLELGRAYRGTALLLRDLIEEDDEYTGRHTADVVALAVRVADELGVDEDTRRATELGALLHDIGKIAIPDEVINKPGPLDEDEWALMRTHTIEGERMLQRVGGLLARVGKVVRASHERWDGGGYPDGLSGEAIPIAARVVSAADAYNAMTTDRPYRSGLPVEVALAELRDKAGTQFDPRVVTALVAVIEEASAPSWELGMAGAPPRELAAPARQAR